MNFYVYMVLSMLLTLRYEKDLKAFPILFWYAQMFNRFLVVLCSTACADGLGILKKPILVYFKKRINVWNSIV